MPNNYLRQVLGPRLLDTINSKHCCRDTGSRERIDIFGSWWVESLYAVSECWEVKMGATTAEVRLPREWWGNLTKVIPPASGYFCLLLRLEKGFTA